MDPALSLALIHRSAWKGNSANFAVKLSKKSLSGVSSAKIAVISGRNEPSLLYFVGFYAFVLTLARLFGQFQKVNSAKFALWAFSEDEMRRPTPQIRSTLRVCKRTTGSYAHYGRRIGP